MAENTTAVSDDVGGDERVTVDATATVAPAVEPSVRITLDELPPSVDREEALDAVRITVGE